MSAHDSVLLDTQPRMPVAYPSSGGRGVDFHSLDVGTIVDVHTKYSCYRLVVIDPGAGSARVTGGWRFPEPTAVCVEGATAGGSAIKAGWIGIGLRLEMSDGSKRITTSVVQSLTIEPPRPSLVC